MTDTAQTGRMGEDAATDFLRNNGFLIRHRNWRSGRYEIDIVAERGDEIHFVEVKTRKANGLTTPEDAITPHKCQSVKRAASIYLSTYDCREEPIFDLIAVDVAPDRTLEVRYIESIMESNW